jgi:hypothetical protein
VALVCAERGDADWVPVPLFLVLYGGVFVYLAYRHRIERAASRDILDLDAVRAKPLVVNVKREDHHLPGSCELCGHHLGERSATQVKECGHQFHSGCFRGWVSDKTNADSGGTTHCPQCLVQTDTLLVTGAFESITLDEYEDDVV